MSNGYDAVLEGWENVPTRVKSHHVPNLDVEKRKEKKDKSEEMFRIREKIRHFMDNKDRPWNKEGITTEEKDKLKVDYSRFVNSIIYMDPIVFDGELGFKYGISNSGKEKITHVSSGIYGVENKNGTAWQTIEKALTNHVGLWKQTSIDFRQQYGVI